MHGLTGRLLYFLNTNTTASELKLRHQFCSTVGFKISYSWMIKVNSKWEIKCSSVMNVEVVFFLLIQSVLATHGSGAVNFIFTFFRYDVNALFFSLFQIPLIHFFIIDLDLVCSVDYSSWIITNLLHKTIYIPKITGSLTHCSVILSLRCCWPHHQTCIAHLFDIFSIPLRL